MLNVILGRIALEGTRLLIWCFFCYQRRENHMGEKRFIFCPQCHKLILILKGKILADYEVECQNCHTLVTYKAEQKRTVTKYSKHRDCPNGMKF